MVKRNQSGGATPAAGFAINRSSMRRATNRVGRCWRTVAEMTAMCVSPCIDEPASLRPDRRSRRADSRPCLVARALQEYTVQCAHRLTAPTSSAHRGAWRP
jgi:hypothetical protein